MDFSKEYNNEGDRINQIYIGAILTLFGISLFIFSIYSENKYVNKMNNYLDTYAEVVKHNKTKEDLNSVIVSYSVNNISYRKVIDGYTKYPKELGTKISIKYNPSNPKEAIFIDNRFPKIAYILSCFFTITGIYTFISAIVNKDDIMIYPEEEKQE